MHDTTKHWEQVEAWKRRALSGSLDTGEIIDVTPHTENIGTHDEFFAVSRAEILEALRLMSRVKEVEVVREVPSRFDSFVNSIDASIVDMQAAVDQLHTDLAQLRKLRGI